ncbi:MAG: alpha/beta hydrolase [Cyclobacteriaceae bacterium]
MPTFNSNNVLISYEVHGEGDPILMLHGGGVDFSYNYVQTGWVESLVAEGYQVIGIYYRGYGNSDKSSDPSFYGSTNITEDAKNLIDHLKLKSVALFGYSLGTLIAVELMCKYPNHFSKAILMATGDGLIGKPPYILEKIIPGLTKLFSYEIFPSHLPSHVSAYWKFFNELQLDRDVMIAFSQASYPSRSAEEITKINAPTLVISGENDLVLGQGPETAKTLKNGSYIEIKNADHFTLAVDSKAREEVLKFLKDPWKK